MHFCLFVLFFYRKVANIMRLSSIFCIFPHLGVLLFFIRYLGATWLVLLFYAITFFLHFFCVRLDYYYICNIPCKVSSCITVSAMTNHISSETGKIFLVHLHHQTMVHVSFTESLDRVSAVIESCLDLYSSCKPHNYVKISLCNLGDASKFFLMAVTSGFVSDSF